MKEILAEVEQERETAEAMKELQRGENMIKYQAEINSRPKKEWFMGKGKRSEIAVNSKEDLKRIKTKFEDQLGNLEHNRNKTKKKREEKRVEKKSAKDAEAAAPKKNKGGSQFTTESASKSKVKLGGKDEAGEGSASEKYYKKKKHLGGNGYKGKKGPTHTQKRGKK